MSNIVQIVTTVPSEVEARGLAQALVERRLAACVQIAGPILSTFWWQGSLETSPEWTCTVKPAEHLLAAAEETIRQHHSYDVPEILVTPVIHAGADYERWLLKEIRPEAPPKGGESQ